MAGDGGWLALLTALAWTLFIRSEKLPGSADWAAVRQRLRHPRQRQPATCLRSSCRPTTPCTTSSPSGGITAATCKPIPAKVFIPSGQLPAPRHAHPYRIPRLAARPSDEKRYTEQARTAGNPSDGRRTASTSALATGSCKETAKNHQAKMTGKDFALDLKIRRQVPPYPAPGSGNADRRPARFRSRRHELLHLAPTHERARHAVP
jgi:hypothetical protein